MKRQKFRQGMSDMKFGLMFLLILATIVFYSSANSFAQPKGDFPGERPKMDPEEMAEKTSQRLKDELDLTDKQYESVFDIYKNHLTEMNNIFDNYSKKSDDMQEIIKKKQSELKLGLSGVFTDEQMEKWESLEKEMNDKKGPPGDRKRPPRDM